MENNKLELQCLDKRKKYRLSYQPSLVIIILKILAQSAGAVVYTDCISVEG